MTLEKIYHYQREISKMKLTQGSITVKESKKIQNKKLKFFQHKSNDSKKEEFKVIKKYPNL